VCGKRCGRAAAWTWTRRRRSSLQSPCWRLPPTRRIARRRGVPDPRHHVGQGRRRHGDHNNQAGVDLRAVGRRRRDAAGVGRVARPGGVCRPDAWVRGWLLGVRWLMWADHQPDLSAAPGSPATITTSAKATGAATTTIVTLALICAPGAVKELFLPVLGMCAGPVACVGAVSGCGRGCSVFVLCCRRAAACIRPLRRRPPPLSPRRPRPPTSRRPQPPRWG